MTPTKKFVVSGAGLLLLCITAVSCFSSGPTYTPLAGATFVAAGVPKDLGSTRNYDTIFSQLKSNGIDGFFPFFSYQSAPEYKTLGFETDFVPPCTASSPAFAAFKKQSEKHVINGGMIYPLGQPLPSIAQDPLAKIIACGGRSAILAITNYDEPTHNGVSVAATLTLYNRVKQIDPTIPVIMIHAPIFADTNQSTTEAERQAYLQAVKTQSQNADIVGFDLYPIPKEVAKLTTPYQNGVESNFITIIDDYTSWMQSQITGKQYTVVLQGFSLEQQYSQELQATIPPEVRAILRAPTKTELVDMVAIAKSHGVVLFIWWGQSLVPNATSQIWKDILEVSRTWKGVS